MSPEVAELKGTLLNATLAPPRGPLHFVLISLIKTRVKWSLLRSSTESTLQAAIAGSNPSHPLIGVTFK
jgi:hypothetical protein